jgi:hypothetical protein
MTAEKTVSDCGYIHKLRLDVHEHAAGGIDAERGMPKVIVSLLKWVGAVLVGSTMTAVALSILSR